MAFENNVLVEGIEYIEVEYLIYNLLLEMLSSQPAGTDRTNPLNIMASYSHVDYSKLVNLEYLKNTLGDNKDLLVTFAFDPASADNTDPYNNRGASYRRRQPFDRVYQLYLTMRASNLSRDLLNKITTIAVQSLTRNDYVYTKTVKNAQDQDIQMNCNLYMSRLVQEPILVNEFEGVATYMTSTLSIIFNIFRT